MRLMFCLILIMVLPACANKKQVVLKNVTEKPIAKANDFPKVQQYIETKNKTKKFKTTAELLEYALKNSRQKPELNRFSNAITVYDYTPGRIYQIYTSPLRVTMISFEKGEKIIAPPQGGDTARWQLTTINSGNNSGQHIIIKPYRDGLTNNLIISTNKGRTYFLELISLKQTYMTAVNWNYPNQHINIDIKPVKTIAKANKIHTNYKIKNVSGKPIWKPTEVYDNGCKTFIKFSDKVQQHEFPVLFIATKETKSQLVNYRVKNNQMIVDRLFKSAELRLGLKKPEIIRIIRKG